jgi:hypothetical protein
MLTSYELKIAATQLNEVSAPTEPAAEMLNVVGDNVDT